MQVSGTTSIECDILKVHILCTLLDVGLIVSNSELYASRSMHKATIEREHGEVWQTKQAALLVIYKLCIDSHIE